MASPTSVRLFDLNNNNNYASANYLGSSGTIDVNLLLENVFSKRTLKLDPSFLPITNMVISWKDTSLIIYVNCKYAGQIILTSNAEIQLMAMPSLMPNVILGGGNGIFYNSIQTAFIQSKCTGLDFLFPSKSSSVISTVSTTEPTTTTSTTTTSTTTTSTTTTTPTTTTTTTSTTTTPATTLSTPFTFPTTTPDPTLAGKLSVHLSNRISFLNFFLLKEWSIFLPTSVFLNATNIVRLYELSNINVYSSADYYPSLFKIEVNILINNNFNKRTVYFPIGDQTLMPIINMIIIWKTPKLYTIVNCKLVSELTYISLNEINVLSMPYFIPNVLLSSSNGIIFAITNDAVTRAGCSG